MDSSIKKKIYTSFAIVSILENLVFIAAGYFYKVHLIEFEPIANGTLTVCLLFTIISAVWVKIKHPSSSLVSGSLYWGVVIAIILDTLQLLMTMLKDTALGSLWAINLQKLDLGSAALAFFMFSLYFYVAQEVIRTARQEALKEQAEHLAYTDMLTEIPNRRALEEKMDGLGEDQQYAIVFIDADGLKAVNDRLGHDNGDLLITTVAEAIKRVAPEDSFYGRWGGDEFMVCLGSAEDAMKFQQELTEELEKASKESPFVVTVSCGIAEHLPGTTSAEEVRNLADQRMYEYKKAHKRAR